MPATRVSDAEKSAVESAAAALEQAIQTDDKADIEAKIEALSNASAEFAQKAYAEPAAGSADAGSDQPAGSDGGDTVDAEFEEVKDDQDGGKKGGDG